MDWKTLMTKPTPGRWVIMKSKLGFPTSRRPLQWFHEDLKQSSLETKRAASDYPGAEIICDSRKNFYGFFYSYKDIERVATDEDIIAAGERP